LLFRELAFIEGWGIAHKDVIYIYLAIPNIKAKGLKVAS